VPTHLYRPALAVGLALAVLTGCQSYQPRPLDSGEYLDAWSSRSADDESLRAFIDSLDQHHFFAPFDLQDGIDLHEAERIALFYNPDLRLARLRAGVDAANAQHARKWDDPELGIDAVRITESVPDRWIVTSSLSITIPISGRLSAERQRTDATLRASLAAIAEQEWSTRAELRGAWVEWSATRLRAERTEHLLESISSLVESTDRLAQAGELPATQASLFAIERLNRTRSLYRLRTEAFALEQRLRALMGLSPDAELVLNPSLTPVDAIMIPDTGTLIERHPMLNRLRDEYAVAEATLLREIRAQYPDLTIGPAYESDQGQSRFGLIGGIPLPILNANARGIAEARAQRELARALYETTLERTMHELRVAIERVDQARTQRTMYESEIVPLVDRQLGDAQRLLELGESDGLVLLESLTRAAQAAMELIDTRLEESLAINQLRSLVGPELPTVDEESISTNENTDTHTEVQP
jgi:outer membrane protein TolC